MRKTVSLNESWQLRHEPLACGAACASEVGGKADGWLPVAALPCDIHMPLVEAGLIREPTVANNCFDCEWTEERSWWFKKNFTAEAAWLAEDNVELVMEALDCMGDVFLNGTHIGFHRSAMYPFRKEVRNLLQPGENRLLVRLTAGTDRFSREDVDESAPWVACEWRGRDSTRGDDRRAMLRKPQYVFGWDQSLRIATCGIMGDVYLELCSDTVIRDVAVRTEAIEEDGGATVLVTVEADSVQPVFAPAMQVTVALAFGGETVAEETREHFGLPGSNFVTFRLRLPRAMLWWPNGAGEQNLYDVSATVLTQRGGRDSKTIRAGIRTVQVCHDRLEGGERLFCVRVNGRRIFCKGANWIHSDALYCRTSPAHRAGMLQAARDAHFNMVRAWGGNAYERDDFYAACDRLGLMVYQEFAYACAGYPDNLEWFRQEAEREAVYQVRRLRSHPSVVIWSGNGECTGHLISYKGMNLFAGDKKPAFTGGTQLFNYRLPQVMQLYAPDIYYWTASPYGGENDPGGDECGDQHRYISLDFRPENTQNRISPEYYDNVNCKFVSEFGYFGPPGRAEVERYCGGRVQMGDAVWKNHTNTFECGVTLKAIEKHYRDTDGLALDEFLLYGGLFQGAALEYALGSLRCLPHNWGTLVWCFNDNYGELGFSLMDHGGNAKIAYHFVRRAYAPVRLLLRRDGDGVNLWCTNDTPRHIDLPVECGYCSFEGEKKGTEGVTVQLDPFCKARLAARLPLEGHDLLRGVLYASSARPGVDSATFHAADFRALQIPRRAALIITDAEQTPFGARVTVTADIYAHAVHFGLPGGVRLSDEYFDLLPGEGKRVEIYAAGLRPETLAPTCVFVGEAQRG